MSIKKEDVLNNLEEVKQYILEAENKKEEKVVGIAIKNRFTDSIQFQSTKTTYREAVKEAINSGSDLSRADLSGADLSEADLRGADLSGADLRGVYLKGADLSEADLSEADLRGADLSEADLSEADLRGAYLSEAELQNAKFYGKTINPQILKRNQLDSFLGALGFKIED